MGYSYAVMKKPWLLLTILVLLTGAFLLMSKIAPQSSKQTIPSTNQRIIQTSPATQENTSLFAFEEYKNEKLGVSFTYPKETLSYYGKCKKDENGYYITDLDLLPVTVIEDGNTLYITNPSFFEATDEKTVEEYIYNTKCDKVETTIARLRDNKGTGHIIKIATVQNDTDINKFIKDIAGDGCVLGEKTKKENGQFAISIKDIGSKLISGCQVNGPITYNPVTKKVLYFRYGQDCVFFQGKENNEVCLSDTLRDSIQMF